ncbi:MAG TPA: hypothetical protein VGC45_15640 [Gryllotalpicola sp.]
MDAYKEPAEDALTLARLDAELAGITATCSTAGCTEPPAWHTRCRRCGGIGWVCSAHIDTMRLALWVTCSACRTRRDRLEQLATVTRLKEPTP